MIEQINNLAQLWWDWASAMFWQVGLLIALIALLDKLIRRWAWPQLRYALWSLVLIKLVLSPTLSLPSGLAPRFTPIVMQVLETAVRPTAVEEELPAVIPYLQYRVNPLAARSESGVVPSVANAPAIGDSGATNIPILTAGLQPNWRSYAMFVWFGGMVTLGVWLLAKLRRLGKEHPDKSGKASLPQSFHDQLADCAKHLGLKRKPTPVVTGSIRTPAVFGLFRPVLLMPVGYIRNLSRKDTEYLLLHELAHVKRGDLVTHSLYMCLQLVYWYNPLLWLVRRRLRHLRELCCDATVADLLRDRTVEYRRTLLDAARQFLITPVDYGLGLVGLFEDANFLIARIKWLEKPVWRYRKMKNAAVTIMVLTLVACVLPMAQAQQDAVSDAITAATGPFGEVAAEEVEVVEVEAEAADLAEAEAEVVEIAEAERTQARKLEELLKAMQALQFQLQQLETQKRKLEHELHALSHAEHQAHQAADHAAHAQLKTKEAKDKAAKAADKAKQAKDKSERGHTHAAGRARIAGIKSVEWQQWAEQMEDWATHYKTWADSDEFKQWQKDVQLWAQDLARLKVKVQAGEPGSAPEPGPMPVMPTLPSMPMPVAPAAPMPPDVVLPDVTDIVRNLPLVGGAAEIGWEAFNMPAEEIPLAKPGRDIEVKKDDSGKYVATTLMHFVAKAQSGKPFVVRNKLGSIILRPSKDGTCDVRARIRGTAKSPDQARAMVEAVGMKLDSSEKRYYLEPVRHDGGKWDNLSVDLQITVPPGVLPDVKTELGSVELRDLKGRIKAVTNLGGIKAVNTTGDIELVTNMGSIEFIAPKDLSAKLSVRTKMGSIKSDLPLEINKSGMFKKGAQGTIGAGQGNIRMSTDMGSIHLKWHSPPQNSAAVD
jgi:beta-lactamase regulating signal transducer with metallopeptidase domain